VTSVLDDALDELRAERAVVIPTDTVYGIAALPSSAAAVRAVFAAKGRPDDKALPVLGASVDDLCRVALFDDRARALARTFWPGPLTIVLPRVSGFDTDLGGDGETVAVRIPRCAPALALLERSGPLAVTSANRSGEPPAGTVAEARAALAPAVRVYLDGGTLTGTPSTIVSLARDPAILREGSLPSGEVLSALG